MEIYLYSYKSGVIAGRHPLRFYPLLNVSRPRYDKHSVSRPFKLMELSEAAKVLYGMMCRGIIMGT